MEKIQWKYAGPVDSGRVREFEAQYRLSFPLSFVEVVTMHNYGYPNPCQVPVGGRSISVKCLLSFDRADGENIWDFTEGLRERAPQAVPFALDNFGNLFVFTDGAMQIGYWEHETMELLPVCESFDRFLKLLER